MGTLADEIAALATVFREAADAAGRPMPVIAPRLPIALGPAPVGSTTAGRLRVLQAEPAEMVELLRAHVAADVSETVLFFWLARRILRRRAPRALRGGGHAGVWLG